MEDLKRRKLLLIIGAVLLLSVLMVFRGKISQFLSFGNAPQFIALEEKKPEHAFETSPAKNVGEPSDKNPDKAVGKKAIVGFPPYSGRDPAEIRPVPDEVKLFTEEQKNQLFGKLEEHGRAVKADSSFFNGWIQVGLLKKVIGDFEGARDAWEYAGVIQPKNSLSFSNLGELYWRYLREYRKAESNFKTAISHKPDDWQNYVSMAELYHYSYKEKYDLSDDVLLDGLKALPEDGTLTRRLAYLYEQRSEFAKALEWWEKILVQNPGDKTLIDKVDSLKIKLQK